MPGEALLELGGEVDAHGRQVPTACLLGTGQPVVHEELDGEVGQERHGVGDGAVEVEDCRLGVGE